MDKYIEALEAELIGQEERTGIGPIEVDSLYIGGGTPTQFSPEQLNRLFTLLARWYIRANGCEFTIEANPADITPPIVQALVAGGVNRVSLGVQSFSDAKLQSLDRDHSAVDTIRAIELLRPVVPQLALDLIFAAPGESVQHWQGELDRALSFRPNHISTYGLTIERGTTFWGLVRNNAIRECGDESQRDMYLSSIGQLKSAGFVHYEVSNFAIPGCRSRHNETYWLGGRYAAIGAGASRFVGHERATNHRSTTTYLKRVLNGIDPTAERELLDLELQARERVVFGLRRIEGIDIEEISHQTETDVKSLLGSTLDKFVAQGWLIHCTTTYRLSEAGLLISDALWPDLL